MARLLYRDSILGNGPTEGKLLLRKTVRNTPEMPVSRPDFDEPSYIELSNWIRCRRLIGCAT